MRVEKILGVIAGLSLLANAVQADPISAGLAQITNDTTLIAGWNTQQLVHAVPFNSTSGNAVPRGLKIFGVEFGVEAVVSDSKLDTSGLRSLPTSIINTSQIDVLNRLPMPMILGHAKVGLPFGIDGGIRIGGIPTTTRDNGNTHSSVSNTVFGLDLRKKLIDDTLTSPFGLLVGTNMTWAKGSLDVSSPFNGSAAIPGTTDTATLQNTTGSGHTDWHTRSIGVQAIMNKKILILNPYIGVSANKDFGTVGTAITNSGTIVVKDKNGNVIGTQNFTTIGSNSGTPNDVNLRAMAGIEISILPFISLGINGELASMGMYGGSIGLRAQFR